MNKGVPAFEGIRVSQDRNIARLHPAIHHVVCRAKVNDLLFRGWQIGSGHNSGFQALNLAIAFGAKKIILCGYDLTLLHGVHWHGRHQDGLNNPRQAGVDAWRQHLDRQAPVLAAHGIDLRVAGVVSTLTAYPKMTFEKALR